MSELVPQQGGQQVAPFQRPGALAMHPGLNAGAVAIEQERAIAEAKGQMQLAKMFPRDTNAAYAELMDACKLPALASVAFYNVPRGGGTVSGPSIRLAEEIARVYGNFEYGHREIGRSEGKSEVEVYAWDKEKNNRSIRQITVMHVVDTKFGPKACRDQKDIDDKIANVASKQVRGRILALLPKWMVEAAIQECKKTIAGNNEEPISVRVRKMTQAFAKYGVNTGHLERHLGHKLDDVTGDELADLLGIFNAIKEGAPASEYFGEKDEEKAAEAETTAKEAVAKATTKARTKPPAAEAPAAAQEPDAPAEKPKAQESNPVKTESKPVKAETQPAVEETAPPPDDIPPADEDEVF